MTPNNTFDGTANQILGSHRVSTGGCGCLFLGAEIYFILQVISDPIVF